MQNNSKNTDIDLVLEIRPWTFIQSRRSDIHYYYHAVENLPMMFDGFESLPIKIDGKRLGMVNYSDSQKKDFKQLTGVYMDELMLGMQLLKYFSDNYVRPFEVENEEILTNILRDIFAENLARQDKADQIERLITSWFDQEKGFFESETRVNSLRSINFIWFVSYESNIKLDELIDLEEWMESKERVIELMGMFYAKEKDKRMKSIKSISAPPPGAEELIDNVNGLDCAEFDNLFGTDIKRKNEVWQYMKLLGMIDQNGACLIPNNTSFIKSFIIIMKKYFKIPNQSDTRLIEIFTLKILGKSKRIHTSVPHDEKRIEDFLNVN